MRYEGGGEASDLKGSAWPFFARPLGAVTHLEGCNMVCHVAALTSGGRREFCDSISAVAPAIHAPLSLLCTLHGFKIGPIIHRA